ncbi:hypothetical protein LSUB1_G002345 [Lachnellula subtilissima]|uniref:Uncharacterized protein n=1 Tax=Lachnellula subtilissima TaxID=602034 RepID=A0A8H8UDK3_9HELO|nr:hypothetical protein LSUB1_G002345 [Lachnellula subtilissima]
MPNWKTYESSVRLLSAIVAAHPSLKLNYDEVSRFYGGGTKYKAVWDRMTQITKTAKLLKAAVDNGQDPITVEVADIRSSSKAQDISARYGGDCTNSAIENRMRRVKTDAKRINNALTQGIDPITLIIEGHQGEVAARGKGRGQAVLLHSFSTNTLHTKSPTRLLLHIRDIHAILQVGGDPGEAVLRDLDFVLRTANLPLFPTISFLRGATLEVILMSRVEIARWFGSDATPKAVSNVVGQIIRPYIQKVASVIESGGDPKDIPCSEFTWHCPFSFCLKYRCSQGTSFWSHIDVLLEISRYYGADANKKSILNVFARFIRPDVKLLNDTVNAGGNPQNIDFKEFSFGEILLCYGSHATKSGLQTHFQRDINPNVKAMLDARKKGDDAKDIVLIENVRQGKPGKGQRSVIHSSAPHVFLITKRGISHYFERNIVPNAKAFLAARKQGEDTTNVIMVENITKCYDSGMKSHTLYAHVWGKVKPMTKAISKARERGDNPMDIPLTVGLQEGGTEKG